MKFAWLVRAHTWVSSIVFGNFPSNRTIDVGENVSKTVFWLSFSQYGLYSGKNFKIIFDTPFSIEKIIFIFVVKHSIPQKNGPPPPPKKKLFFAVILKNIVLFFKKLSNEKYSKSHFLQERLYRFLSPDASFTLKRSCPHTNSFSQCQCKLKNIHEVLFPQKYTQSKENFMEN